jgi:phosphatidylserine/phosphatidylglycerophosphate/cardiolipin synthase-like enzyme
MNRRLIATLLASVLLFTTAPLAQAAAPIDNYVPRAGLLFNVPKNAGGTEAEQKKLSRFLIRTLDSMNSGAVFRGASYDWNVPEVADAVIRADQRGVHVRLIFDRGAHIQEQRLMAALGGDIAANQSFAIACQMSCNSAATSAMHNKFFTISSTGYPATARRISLIGSANVTLTNESLNWNETQVLADSALYLGLTRFFDRMRFDRSDEDVFTTVIGTNPRYVAYLWPAGTRAAASNVFLKTLRSMPSSRCRNVPAEYGNGRGRGLVSVPIFFHTYARAAEARELARLHKAGCDVRYLYVRRPRVENTAQPVLDILWDARVPMWNTWRDFDGDGRADLYTHGKAMIVSGYAHGKYVSLSYNGSANWTRSALTSGNEVTLRINGDATFEAYLARHNQIRDLSVRETSRPVNPDPGMSTQRHAVDEPEYDDLGRL